jgi:hypothetical protein
MLTRADQLPDLYSALSVAGGPGHGRVALATIPVGSIGVAQGDSVHADFVLRGMSTTGAALWRRGTLILQGTGVPGAPLQPVIAYQDLGDYQGEGVLTLNVNAEGDVDLIWGAYADSGNTLAVRHDVALWVERWRVSNV